MEKKIIAVVAVALVAVTLLARVAEAQSPGGAISGTAVVAEGTPAAGAGVLVVSRMTGATRKAHTDAQGRFAVTGLPPGPYEVTLSLDGYAPRRQEDIQLDASATVTLRLELAHAAAADTLTLAPLPRVIEPTRSHPKAVISEAELTNLPIRERDAIDLVALVPGAFASPFGGFAVNGNLGATSVVVDGTDRLPALSWSQEYFPRVRIYPFALESLQQVAVNTVAYSAEYGDGDSAAIQVVTKSGSNRFRGSAFTFFGDDALTSLTTDDARAGVAKRPLRYLQYGGTVGGPLAFDRHFFFGSIDRRTRTTVPGEPDLGEDIVFVRTDHQFGGGHLTARYNGEEVDLFNAVSDRRLHVSGGVPLGTYWFTEPRVQYGQDRASGIDLRLTHAQVGDTVTFARGDHQVKSGFDAERHRLDGAGTGTALSLTHYDWFAQDQWQVSNSTTINGGVRLEGERAAGASRHDWGPRAGISWSPGTRRLVVRGAYGMVRPPLSAEPAAITDVPFASDSESIHQASAGVEWEWLPHVSLGTTAQHVQGKPFGIPLKYDAVTFELLRRYSQGIQYRVAYTFGRLRGIDIVDRENYPGHHLALSLVYDTDAFADRFLGGRLEPLLKDWTVSAVYNAQTDAPLAFASVDPRLARHIRLGGDRRLSLIWEAYDLTNRPNYTTAYAINRPPRREARTSRVMQLAARFSF